MKKVLIALGLVALMTVSSFAVSLELMNVLSMNNAVMGPTGNAPAGGVGLGFMAGPVDMIVGIDSWSTSSTTNGTIIILKGLYPVYGDLNAGLQIDMMSSGGTSTTAMSLLVGVKKTLVTGVILRLEGIVYSTDGATTNANTDMLNGGACIGLSIPL